MMQNIIEMNVVCMKLLTSCFIDDNCWSMHGYR